MTYLGCSSKVRAFMALSNVVKAAAVPLNKTVNDGRYDPCTNVGDILLRTPYVHTVHLLAVCLPEWSLSLLRTKRHPF